MSTRIESKQRLPGIVAYEEQFTYNDLINLAGRAFHGPCVSVALFSGILVLAGSLQIAEAELAEREE